MILVVGMKLTRLEPIDDLKSIIYDYYLIENTEVSHDNLPPLGYPVIKFHLRNHIRNFYSNYNFPVSNVMIVGQLSKYAHIKQEYYVKMIGVNLKPTALFKLLKVPVNVFTDKGTIASLYFGNEIEDINTNLCKSKNNDEILYTINNYFAGIAKDIPKEADRFDNLIDFIQSRNGIVSGKELQDYYAATERTIQRLFSERIGVSPKTYCRVLRHLNIFKIISQKPDIKYSELIYECGYDGPAHFTSDFKLISGVSPKEYFSKRENLSHLISQM